jgi:hypothetical protein
VVAHVDGFDTHRILNNHQHISALPHLGSVTISASAGEVTYCMTVPHHQRMAFEGHSHTCRQTGQLLRSDMRRLQCMAVVTLKTGPYCFANACMASGSPMLRIVSRFPTIHVGGGPGQWKCLLCTAAGPGQWKCLHTQTGRAVHPEGFRHAPGICLNRHRLIGWKPYTTRACGWIWPGQLANLR